MIEVVQNNQNRIPKPFIKWVGGKTQLLSDINNNLQDNILDSIYTYVEPFIGGGAVLFNIVPKLHNVKNVIINDLNFKLTNVYNIIKNNHYELIHELNELENKYYNVDNHLYSIHSNSDLELNKIKLKTIFKDNNIEKLSVDTIEITLDKTGRGNMYYEIRKSFNKINSIEKYNALTEDEKIKFASEFIFLNKTCFNGLYRENKKGEFNAPWNKSDFPCILDKENIVNVHDFLNRYNVTILTGNYYDIFNLVDYRMLGTMLVYIDPPYRPITKSSAFTSYTKSGFNDDNQKELKEFCDNLHMYNNYFMVSNSDPHNSDINDNFFDDLYKDYNIVRVNAKRNINSKGNKRGNITELLIKNF